MFSSYQVFGGNIDTHSIKKQILPTPIEATFVRIYPQEFVDWMCMRVELYGKGMYIYQFLLPEIITVEPQPIGSSRKQKKKHVP